MRRLLCLLVALVHAAGCFTGSLVEAGRRTERPLRFEAAYSDGVSLWSRYRAEVIAASGEVVAVAPRGARVHLADLDPDRGLAIDTVPVEHLAADALPEGLPPLALVPPDATPPAGGAPHLRVVADGGRDLGLWAGALPGATPDAYLDARSLIDRPVAAWTLPLLPFALVCDAVAIPVLVLAAVPYFGGSD